MIVYIFANQIASSDNRVQIPAQGSKPQLQVDKNHKKVIAIVSCANRVFHVPALFLLSDGGIPCQQSSLVRQYLGVKSSWTEQRENSERKSVWVTCQTRQVSDPRPMGKACNASNE